MGNFICFANPRFLEKAISTATYGNFGQGSEQQLWSILRDIIAIKPGDAIFFYETEKKYFHGVFEAISEPFVCNDNLFNEGDETYPFRFHFRRRVNFTTNVPQFEFIHLIDKKIIWSISTLAKDPTSPFRSIVNISNRERDALIQLFLKYNIATGQTVPVNKIQTKIDQRIEAIDIISGKELPNTETAIDVNVLPVAGSKKKPVCRYEFALQAFFAYHLSRRTKIAVNVMGNYNESLTEVPLSAAELRRIDILCTHQQEGKNEPLFYHLVELKPRVIYSLERLRQLIGYLRMFSQKKAVEFGDVIGSIIAPDYTEDTINYLQERALVETEKPIRLIKYVLNQEGHILFNMAV
ncbi:hypothetical protein ES703_49544 [subsurface metagenome]